ncbi:MAG: hypothetical protein JNM94_09870 [Phycisphaerae bacterium]|nr:hypothetical protein [Phycisphaerae bacterium]
MNSGQRTLLARCAVVWIAALTPALAGAAPSPLAPRGDDTPAQPAKEKTPLEIAMARFKTASDDLSAAIEKEKAELVATIDKEIEKRRDGLGGASGRNEETLAEIDRLTAERTSFLGKGFVPLSKPLRKASMDYVAAVRRARDDAKPKFDSVERTIAGLKNEGALRTVQGRAKEFLSPKAIAKFRYRWAPGKVAEWTLYDDGRLNADATWTSDGDTFVFRGADKTTLKGGAWKDTCRLSDDGRTLDGKNTLGHQKHGERID